MSKSFGQKLEEEYIRVIEKHLYVAKIVTEDYPCLNKDGGLNKKSGIKSGIKSDLDDLFLISVPVLMWDKYRKNHNIKDMKISPYYDNKSLFEK